MMKVIDSKNRFCVLGLDAMDLRVVKRLNLKNLLLNYNGELKIPLYDKYHTGKKIAFSPVIWSSFLTGKNADEHKTYNFYRYDNPIIQKIAVDFSGHPLLRGTGRIAKKIGLKKKPAKAKGRTIFDLPNAKAIQFLGYNYVPEKWTDLCKEYESSNWTRKEFYFKLINIFKEETFKGKKSSEALNEWWSSKEKIVGFYTPFLDYCQHVFPNSPGLIDHAYQTMNRFVKLVLRECPNVLIVADHGFEGNNHSKTGYWSSTRPFNVEKITDFYSIFKNELEG